VAATTFTSVVLVAFAVLLLTMASYAWFGDWEPQPRRVQPRRVQTRRTRRQQDGVSAEVAALRQAIEAYEREHRSR
jgi:hypothetical protein